MLRDADNEYAMIDTHRTRTSASAGAQKRRRRPGDRRSKGGLAPKSMHGRRPGNPLAFFLTRGKP